MHQSPITAKDAAGRRRDGGLHEAVEAVEAAAPAAPVPLPARLPHHDRIQASFGSHDISHVQASTGGTAAAAARTIGAQAYATGSRIAFVDAEPSIHTAAHEAAHVIQQQAGVQLPGEALGPAGR